MKGKTNEKAAARARRQHRVRGHIRGTTERPRLTVFRSSRHIYAQIIDDTHGTTLAAASTLSPELAKDGTLGGGKKGAVAVGELISRRAAEKGVTKVVFDRNGFIYQKGGILATLAESARKGGLDF